MQVPSFNSILLALIVVCNAHGVCHADDGCGEAILRDPVDSNRERSALDKRDHQIFVPPSQLARYSEPHQVTVTQDGNFLVIGTERGIEVRSALTGEMLHRKEDRYVNLGTMVPAPVSNGASAVIAYTRHDRPAIQFYDARARRSIQTVELASDPSLADLGAFCFIAEKPQFSSDGRSGLLVLKGRVIFFEVQSGRILKTMGEKDGPWEVIAAEWSPAAKQDAVVTFRNDRFLILNVQDGRTILSGIARSGKAVVVSNSKWTPGRTSNNAASNPVGHPVASFPENSLAQLSDARTLKVQKIKTLPSTFIDRLFGKSEQPASSGLRLGEWSRDGRYIVLHRLTGKELEITLPPEGFAEVNNRLGSFPVNAAHERFLKQYEYEILIVDSLDQKPVQTIVGMYTRGRAGEPMPERFRIHWIDAENFIFGHCHGDFAPTKISIDGSASRSNDEVILNDFMTTPRSRPIMTRLVDGSAVTLQMRDGLVRAAHASVDEPSTYAEFKVKDFSQSAGRNDPETRYATYIGYGIIGLNATGDLIVRLNQPSITSAIVVIPISR